MRSPFVCTFLFSILFGGIAFAQSGSIGGEVVELESGFEVIGASLLIEETSTGTVTGLDGQYTIDGLKAGTYTLRCSYLGFEDQVLKVLVKGGERTSIDIKLGEDAEQIRTVVVEAEAITKTDAGFLAQQRKNSNVVDGIPASQIQRSGDSDAASAIKRITGVTIEGGKYVYVRGLGDRYSKTTMNGLEIPSLDPNKNTVQMDLFPANLLDNIMVYKTFSPDLPGDFTGGYIDITTKEFPEAFTLKVSSSAGYNTITHLNKHFLVGPHSRTDWMGFDNGFRDVPENVAEIQASGSFPEYQVGANIDAEEVQDLVSLTGAFKNSWSQGTEMQPLDHSLSISLGNKFDLAQKNHASSLGLIAAFTYRRSYSFYEGGQYGIYALNGSWDQADRLTPQLTLKDTKSVQDVLWGGMLSMSYKITSGHKITAMFMRNQSGSNSTRFLSGLKQKDDADELFMTRTWRYLERGLSTFQLGGKHVFAGLGKLKLNWRSAYSVSTQEDPDLRYFTNRYDEDNDSYTLKPSSDRLPSRFYRSMEQGNWSSRIDLVKPFKQWNGLSSTFKTGATFLFKNRSFRENRYTFNDQSFAFGGDPYGYFADSNLIAYDADLGTYTNNGTGVYVTDDLDPANNYDANQTVWAAYAMTKIPLSRNFRFIGGLRMETTALKFSTFSNTILNKYPNLDGNAKILDNLDFLPAAAFNYELSDTMKLRFAYSRTLARPSFREIAPFASFDVEGGYLFVGNPELERTLVDNFDLRWEFAPSFMELLSLSGFYKHFANPIERTYNPEQPNGEFTFRNVDEAFLLGAEMEARFRLSTILGLGALKDFSLSTNFSYIYSQTTIDSAEYNQIRATNPYAKSTRAMFGQSPYSVNALISYKNQWGTSCNLVFNVSGKKIAYITTGGTPNIYNMPLPSLNFNASHAFKNGLTLRIAANNLLLSKYRDRIQFKEQNYNVQTYDLGMDFSFGLSYSFSSTKA